MGLLRTLAKKSVGHWGISGWSTEGGVTHGQQPYMVLVFEFPFAFELVFVFVVFVMVVGCVGWATPDT